MYGHRGQVYCVQLTLPQRCYLISAPSPPKVYPLFLAVGWTPILPPAHYSLSHNHWYWVWGWPYLQGMDEVILHENGAFLQLFLLASLFSDQWAQSRHVILKIGYVTLHLHLFPLLPGQLVWMKKKGTPQSGLYMLIWLNTPSPIVYTQPKEKKGI